MAQGTANLLVVLLVIQKEKELRNYRNSLIFNVVPTGLEPVTP